MAENNSVKLTFGYKDTDFTRTYKFDGLSAGVLDDVKPKILALNASIAGGSGAGIEEFFLADDYAAGASATVGTFTGIVAAQIDTVEEIVLNLNG